MIRTVSKTALMPHRQPASNASPLWQRIVCTTAVFLLALFHSSAATPYVVEASQNGFVLKKIVSDTKVCSGQYFSYTIDFSCAPNTTSMNIVDNLPPSVAFQSVTVTGGCGPASIAAPAVGSQGGTVSVSWGAIPSGCSGSMVIVVYFPNGTTCDGTQARNRVCLNGRIDKEVFAQFCTDYVVTTAMAYNPWHISKQVLNATYQGGTCEYASIDSMQTFEICVYKDVGTTCQLNLENAVVTDDLPPGAVLMSSTCGAIQSGTTVTWNIGSLSALPMYNAVCCTLTVYYPTSLFPPGAGSTITNEARLYGVLGSLQKPCGDVDMLSNKVCIELKEVIISDAWVYKWVYTNGRPGCAGQYYFYIYNSGNVPINTYSINDVLPTTLTGYSVSAVYGPGSVTTSITPGPPDVFNATSTAPLNPGEWVYIVVDFTIPITATIGSTITNCADFDLDGNIYTSCTSFNVLAPQAQACLWKEVCSKQPSYTPGSIFRYRLRVQNIGGLPLSGATITDVLDPNLTYIGNPSFYTGTWWGAPCQTTSNWSGVTTSISGNTLTFGIPTIPAVSCTTLFYYNCGMYGTGGVPYYFIEFDVKVNDDAALGNIPNYFTMSGGSLPGTETSNTDYVLVIGTYNFNVDKSVAPDITTWASSITAGPGSTANYRLNLNVGAGSVALRHVTFADLLPRDNGASDEFILGPCPFPPRTSPASYDVTYAGTVSTTPAAGGYDNPLSFARVNNFTPLGAPGPMYTASCGGAGTWSSGLVVGDKNLGYYFGSTGIPAGGSATAIFTVDIPPGAQNQELACNTFAANGAVRHLINSTTIVDIPVAELESKTACITIQDPPIQCISVNVQTVTSLGTNAAGECVYSIVADINNPNAVNVTGWFTSPQGTLTPTSGTFPPGVTTQTFTFTDTPPSDMFVCIVYGIVINGVKQTCGEACFDLPPCNTPPEECCRDFVHTIKNNWKYSDATGVVWLGSTVIAGPAPIKRFSATIVSAQRRRWCYGSPAGGWERIYGDIVNGYLGNPPASGPQLLSTYSREAVWGPGQCVDWNQGTWLYLQMIFPPPPCAPCRDELIFTIRYSFTDCNCRTCDTLITDTLSRTCKGTWGGSDDYADDGSLGLMLGGAMIPGLGFEHCATCPGKNMSLKGPSFIGDAEYTRGDNTDGNTADMIGEEKELALTNVRTYALYFTNTNSDKRTIHSLILHPESNMQILAVGPSSIKGESTLLTPERTASGTFTIKTALNSRGGVQANETVSPIFITVSGSLNVADFGFTSLDADNNPVSSGKFTLSNAVSSVENLGDAHPLDLTMQPNPTTTSTTLSFSLVRTTTNATLGIYNEQGQEVLNVFANTSLERGNHVMTADVSSLASGVYFVVLRTPLGTVSQPMTICR